MFGMNGRKPRQFSYNPRYYDAEKEARNQRRIELGHAPLEDSDTPSERKPGDLLRARAEMRAQETARDIAARKKSNMMRMLFAVLLIAGFCALLKSVLNF